MIDALRGTTGKFDPQAVTRDYAELCSAYRVHTVMGDAYAREWVAGAWRDARKRYVQSPRPKGELYLESLPIFTRGLIRFADHTKLVRELRLLERRTHRSGKDTVEHPRNGHDDYANAVCGVLAGETRRPLIVTDAALQRIRMSGLFSARVRHEAEFNMHRVRF